MSKNNKRLKETSDFGDERLNKRLGKICDNFSKQIDSSIPQNHADRSQMKAGYNFFKNKKSYICGSITNAKYD